MAQAEAANKAGNKKGRGSRGQSKKADKKAEKTVSAVALYEPERCERCGAVVIETHCKVLCTNCGFMRDCNDQW